MDLAAQLASLAEYIRADLNTRSSVRDRAIYLSREQIRCCNLAVRALHRSDWATAEQHLSVARDIANQLFTITQPYPELYASGYTQDAMKELAEAHIVFAVIANRPLPEPSALRVEIAAWLNGLAEAVGELRRRVLDCLRSGYGPESERLLHAMDEIYELLVTMDFPEALTNGLRRNTDMVRGLVERTRSELTLSAREAELQQALQDLAQRLQRQTEPPSKEI